MAYIKISFIGNKNTSIKTRIEKLTPFKVFKNSTKIDNIILTKNNKLYKIKNWGRSFTNWLQPHNRGYNKNLPYNGGSSEKLINQFYTLTLQKIK